MLVLNFDVNFILLLIHKFKIFCRSYCMKFLQMGEDFWFDSVCRTFPFL